VHIALIAPPWYPVPPEAYGGIELVVALLARKFEQSGHRVTVFAHPDSKPAGELRSPSGTPPDAGMIGNGLHDAYHALTAYADLDGVDIVHDHSGVVGPAIASRGGKLPPVVHTLHGPWTSETRNFYELVDESVHLVAISETQRSDNPNVRYAATIHNGIDLSAYPANLDNRGDELVYIGRANPGKNPDGAIRVARASGRPLKLVIKRHEPNEKEYWEQRVQPLLGSDIEVFEGIDHKTKVELLQHADAMIFPIEWPEPFGLVMIEAMSCGTPVLATRRGAATEVVEHGATGFLCDSEHDMVAAIARIPELERRACRQRVKAHFSARRMATDYERLFRRLTQSPAKDHMASQSNAARPGSKPRVASYASDRKAFR
jgi:glycosyltransferase involved in cell wall biosynthesis